MITFSILLTGTATFIFALFTHIIIWRAKKVFRQIMLLGIIFILLPLVLYTIIFIYYIFGGYPDYLSAVIFSLVWHITLSSFYIASYPLFQAKCPTFAIILAVDSSMPKGITAESIKDIFDQDMLLNERVKDLIDEGLLVLKNDGYVPSLKGLLLSFLFSIYRSLLGLPLGEG